MMDHSSQIHNSGIGEECPDDKEQIGVVRVHPRLVISEDNQVVVDQASLFIPRKETSATYDPTPVFLPTGSPVIERRRKSKRGKQWNLKDTAKFYESIREVGLDLSMQQRDLPNKNRHQLKRKLRKESDCNPHLMEKALFRESQFNPDFLNDFVKLDHSNSSSNELNPEGKAENPAPESSLQDSVPEIEISENARGGVGESSFQRKEPQPPRTGLKRKRNATCSLSRKWSSKKSRNMKDDAPDSSFQGPVPSLQSSRDESSICISRKVPHPAYTDVMKKDQKEVKAKDDAFRFRNVKY